MPNSNKRLPDKADSVELRRRFFLIILLLGVLALIIRFLAGSSSRSLSSVEHLIISVEVFLLVSLIFFLIRDSKYIQVVQSTTFFATMFGILIGLFTALSNSTFDQVYQDPQITEIVYWFPGVYLLAYIAFDTKRGLYASISFWVFIAGISIWTIFTRDSIGGHFNEIAYIARVFIANAIIIGFLHFWSVVSRAGAKLELESRFYEVLSNHDELTGIPNRRFIQGMLYRELERQKRTGKVFSVVVFDINDFKYINDELGHGMGDRVLIKIAEAFWSSLRGFDTVARIGGDEFLLLLPATTAKKAKKVADRFVNIISGLEIDGLGQINISYGLADSGQYSDISELLAAADKEMYIMKRLRKQELSQG